MKLSMVRGVMTCPLLSSDGFCSGVGTVRGSEWTGKVFAGACGIVSYRIRVWGIVEVLVRIVILLEL